VFTDWKRKGLHLLWDAKAFLKGNKKSECENKTFRGRKFDSEVTLT
jgi:hypothetical protein